MTKQISSRATSFYKRIFPILWYAMIALLLIGGIAGAVTHGISRRALPAFFVLAIAFALVSILLRRLYKNLIDEVYDGGDHLLLKEGGEEEILPLTNVMNVSAEITSKPARVTLRLVKPGRFGVEVSFLPARKASLDPFARIPMIDELIERVDRARLRRIV